jgi:hypothetical protein
MKSQLADVKRVAIDTSAREVKFAVPARGVGATGAGIVTSQAITIAAAASSAVFVVCLPCMLAGIAIDASVMSIRESRLKRQTQGMVPVSWIEGVITDGFQRQLSNGGLFDVRAVADNKLKAPSDIDAVIHLSLDTISLVPEPDGNSITLTVTASAQMLRSPPSNEVIWETTETAWGGKRRSLEDYQNDKGALLREDFQHAIDKVTYRMASELIYAEGN